MAFDKDVIAGIDKSKAIEISYVIATDPLDRNICTFEIVQLAAAASSSLVVCLKRCSTVGFTSKAS